MSRSEHIDEVPGHHHRFVVMSVNAFFGAYAVPGTIAGEVSVQLGEGQLSQEEDQADTQEAEPHGGALVGCGGFHCRPQDVDEACYYGCHCQSWICLESQ